MKIPFASIALSLGLLLFAAPSKAGDPDLEDLRSFYAVEIEGILRPAWEGYLKWHSEMESPESGIENPEDRVAVEEHEVSRAVWKGRVESRLEELRGAYMLALDQLVQRKARMGDLDTALAARAELNRIAEIGEFPDIHEAYRLPDEIFAGRTWASPSGTAFTFLEDGSWLLEDELGRVAGKWRRLGQLVVAEVEGDPLATRYFRFATEREGWYGRAPFETELELVPH